MSLIYYCSVLIHFPVHLLPFAPPPPPLFVVMMTTMIITRFCHKAKQCSFLVIFLCTAVLFFFSPSLACVKDASYPRVFTDNILHVCVQ